MFSFFSKQFSYSCLIQRYLTTNLYVFYEVANSYEFLRPHSYDFVRVV